MLVEKVIEQLQKFPAGTHVCIYDHRKNLGDDDGNGSYVGIYMNFDIELHTLEPDEVEWWEDNNDTEFKPWISIAFDNEDYDEDGKLVAA